MKTIKNFKSLLLLLVIGLVTIVLIGCGSSKIELSFEEQKYTIVVGHELDLEPVVVNEDDIEYELDYSSVDPTIATYKNGVVKGLKAGSVVVKVVVKGDEENKAETAIEVVEATKYNVTFETDGGSTIEAVKVVEGEKLAEPTEPTKVGYTFVGWFTNEAKRTPYIFNLSVNNDLNLYAKWEIVKYTVIFDSNGGNEVAEVKVDHGSKVATPDAPTKENSIFVGWEIEEGTLFDFETAVEGDITLNAVWDLVSYEVVFSSGGSAVPNQTVKHGEKLVEPTPPTREGFEFVGWYKDGMKTQVFDFDTDVITGVSVVFGKWKLVSLDSKLHTNGGELTDTNFEKVSNVKEDAVKATQELGFFNAGYSGANAETSIWLYVGDDYIFNGAGAGVEPSHWGYKVALRRIGDNTFVVEKNVRNESDVPQGLYEYLLVGIWRPNLYPGFTFLEGLVAGDLLVIEGVDFNGEPGPVEGMITKTKASDIEDYYAGVIEPELVLPVPEKAGFDFDGWYTNQSFTGEAVTEITEDTTNADFYAKWVAKEGFEVSFDTGVEEFVIYEVYRLPGQKVKAPTLVKEGYELVGWYTDESRTTEYDFDTEITADITLYGKFVEVVTEPTT